MDKLMKQRFLLQTLDYVIYGRPKEYSPDDIFNADETGFHYPVALPDIGTSLKIKIELKGDKTCKKRLTTLCCASMTGKEN